MGIFNKQIGWSQESNLLWEIANQVNKLIGVTSKVSGPQGPQGPAGPAGSINSTGGNVDTLGGVAMRTLYSRTNVITYTVGTEADLMSGSSNFGSRNFPAEFFTNSTSYVAKTIHFRVTGLWASGGGTDTTSTITLKIGNDTLSTITETLPFSRDKPSEIYGEILITNGNAIVCYAVGWCDQTGDYRKTALSDPSAPIDVTGFNGGDFELLIESTTTRNFTSYLGYIQVWN